MERLEGRLSAVKRDKLSLVEKADSMQKQKEELDWRLHELESTVTSYKRGWVVVQVAMRQPRIVYCAEISSLREELSLKKKEVAELNTSLLAAAESACAERLVCARPMFFVRHHSLCRRVKHENLILCIKLKHTGRNVELSNWCIELR